MELDPYIVDVLMPDLVGHDRHPSAFLTYLYLSRHAGPDGVERSLKRIAEGTGLSRRSVQTALERLEARGLVSIRRAGLTSIASFRVRRPWAERPGR